MATMSTPDTSQRPGQVTVGGWAVAVASVFLVISVFDSLGALHSVETREQLAETLDSGNFQGLGISVAELLTVKRWALYVTAVAAVFTGVLGFFVLRKDNVARIVLTVGAVPIVLATPFTGSFLAMMVGAGAAVLWSRPARDWFAGRPITPPGPRRPAPDQRQTPPPPGAAPWVPPTPPASGSPEETGARAFPGWGAPAGEQAPPPPTFPPSGDPAAPPPYPYPPSPVPDLRSWADATRPREVRIACLITWVLTALTAVGYLVLLAYVSIDSDSLVRLVQDSPSWNARYDEDLIVPAVVIGSVVFLLWCAAAAVVAVFAWRGHPWAWIVLAISAGAAAVVATMMFPFSLVHLAGIAGALGLLLGRPARAWFRSQRR